MDLRQFVHGRQDMEAVCGMGELIDICSKSPELVNKIGQCSVQVLKGFHFISGRDGSPLDCADNKCLLCKTGFFDPFL